MIYDAVIIGSGPSGSFWALSLAKAGLKVCLLEAGQSFSAYPDNELEANSRLYWGGGIELNDQATIGLLRAKVLGGGSVVNQALMSPFDNEIWSRFTDASGSSLFQEVSWQHYYDKVGAFLHIQEIPEKYWSGNAQKFVAGCEKVGITWSRLKRAQSDCRYDEGNDCIRCLFGCPIKSKQSMAVTTLPLACQYGLSLRSEWEVRVIKKLPNQVYLIQGIDHGHVAELKSHQVILAAGSLGNTKILWESGFKNQLPGLGKGFYCHPQTMCMAEFDEPLYAHKAAFQSVHSDDPQIRQQGFKLENVFTPPAGMALLIPGFGREHQKVIKRQNYLGCIEVCVRDEEAGTITLAGSRVKVKKSLGPRDRSKCQAGMKLIEKIFRAAGAKKIYPGNFCIGLHLMGGCALGQDVTRSVVNENFEVHDQKGLFIADSSIFPCAPGRNPSYSIMAMSILASEKFLRQHGQEAVL